MFDEGHLLESISRRQRVSASSMGSCAAEMLSGEAMVTLNSHPSLHAPPFTFTGGDKMLSGEATVTVMDGPIGRYWRATNPNGGEYSISTELNECTRASAILLLEHPLSGLPYFNSLRPTLP